MIAEIIKHIQKKEKKVDKITIRKPKTNTSNQTKNEKKTSFNKDIKMKRNRRMSD